MLKAFSGCTEKRPDWFIGFTRRGPPAVPAFFAVDKTSAIPLPCRLVVCKLHLQRGMVDLDMLSNHLRLPFWGFRWHKTPLLAEWCSCTSLYQRSWLSQGQELPLAEWRPNVTEISYHKRSARLWSLKAHHFDWLWKIEGTWFTEIPWDPYTSPNFKLDLAWCCHFLLAPLQSLTAPLHRGAPWGGFRLVVASQKGLSFGRQLKGEGIGDDGVVRRINVFNMISWAWMMQQKRQTIYEV